MDRSHLTLVGRPAAGRYGTRSRLLTTAPALGLLTLAVLATVLGADGSRTVPDAGEVARATFDLAVERGTQDEAVRSSLRRLRDMVGRRPLDSKTRSAYASLLLGVSTRPAELPAPLFHARAAVALAPVTVPVVRRTVLILARAGETDEALRWVRRMFGYDPRAGARLLALLEPSLYESRLDEVLADTPEAWLAWAGQLRLEGRGEAADRLLARGLDRWPADTRVLGQAAALALRSRDWDGLARLLPPDGRLPEDAAAAPLLVYRARLKAELGDPDGARADLSEALDRNPRSPSVRLAAGDLCQALGDDATAARHWSRLLFTLPRDADTSRLAVTRRLARLEERRGRAAAALRLWRAALELDPGDEEARRRVALLTGSAAE